MRAVERSSRPPWNRLTGAWEKSHETRTECRSDERGKISLREARSCLYAPQEIVFELFLRLVSFEALWLARGAQTLTCKGVRSPLRFARGDVALRTGCARPLTTSQQRTELQWGLRHGAWRLLQ